jgi:hypothetical protein
MQNRAKPCIIFDYHTVLLRYLDNLVLLFDAEIEIAMPAFPQHLMPQFLAEDDENLKFINWTPRRLPCFALKSVTASPGFPICRRTIPSNPADFASSGLIATMERANFSASTFLPGRNGSRISEARGRTGRLAFGDERFAIAGGAGTALGAAQWCRPKVVAAFSADAALPPHASPPRRDQRTAPRTHQKHSD